MLSEVANYLEELEALEDSAALNFVNALEDLLWAFECRATASWIFQLAVKRNIYRDNVFRYVRQSLLCKISFDAVYLPWVAISAFHVHIQNRVISVGITSQITQEALAETNRTFRKKQGDKLITTKDDL